MGDYFTPWRRKIGVVTLFLACVMTGGWVRSLSVCEQAYYPNGKQSLIYLVLGDGLILCGRSLANTPDYFPQEPGWYIMPEMKIESTLKRFRWVWQFLDFGIGIHEDNPVQIQENSLVVIPYWSIVIPMTAISAFLLLSKSRKPTPRKITEPIPGQVA